MIRRMLLLLALLLPAGISTAFAQGTDLAYFRRALQPDIEDGRLSIEELAAGPRMVICYADMFATNGDLVEPSLAGVLTRVGYTLRWHPWRVRVTSHTDSDAINTGRFKQSLPLTRARAESATKIHEAVSGLPERFTSVGKGNNEPVADNATDAGKARNRRLEIVLTREPQ